MRLSLIAAVLLCGCATRYAVPEGAPTATLVIEKGYARGGVIGSAEMQEVFVARDEICGKRDRLAFVSFMSGDSIERRIAAGAPVTLVTANTYIGSTGKVEEQCANATRFTPRAGASYRVRQSVPVTGGTCTTTVTETATNEAPADLETLRPPRCVLPD